MNEDLISKIKQRLFYHIWIPLVYIVLMSLVFRYGEVFGGYCGHVALFGIMLFMVFSILYDHKEDIWDLLLWTMIRMSGYTGLSVIFIIFQRKIFGVWF